MRRLLAVLALIGLGIAGGLAQAATTARFEPAAFAAAQGAGKPILVEITASWCPTCAAQRPILDKLAASPDFADLAIYQVDFDAQKDVVKAMHAQMQSTLIVFRGTTEAGRSVGDTSEASIKALLQKSKG